MLLAKRYNTNEHPIASGGMGSVYMAYDTNLQIKCAIKKFELRNDGMSDENRKKAIDLFDEEAKLLAKLKHPNLPRVTDRFSENGQYYFVMDFIEGTNLDALSQSHPPMLTLTDIMDWGIQIAQTLEYCHERGVLHRDVKPANIIITPENKAVLVDFGIAKPGSQVTQATTSFVKAIAPGYSPIEQYGNNGKTDVRSDIYALGATLYTALSSKVPPEATQRIGDAHVFTLPMRKENGVEALLAILNRACHTNPTKRYKNMSDFRQNLASLKVKLTSSSPSAILNTQVTKKKPLIAAVFGTLLVIIGLWGLVSVIYPPPTESPTPTVTTVPPSPTSTHTPTVTSTNTPTSTPTYTATPTPTSPPTPTPTPPLIGTPDINSEEFYKKNFDTLSPNKALKLESISSNLFGNSGLFDTTSLWDKGWEGIIHADGIRWNQGAFSVTVDLKNGYKQSGALYIRGNQIRQDILEPARGGIRRNKNSEVVIEPNNDYVIAFLIRTSNTTNKPTIGINLEGQTARDYIYFDEKAEKCWKLVHIFYPNQSSQFERVSLYLMSFTEGEVWIDNFNIRKVKYSMDSPSVKKTLQMRSDVIDGLCL